MMSAQGSPTWKINETIHKYRESPPSSDSDDDALCSKPRKMRLFGRTKPLRTVLGGGANADIILWKNKQISGGIVASVTVVWMLFEWMNYHLITFICHSLILSLLLLFVWSNAASIVNRPPPKLPEVLLPEDLFLIIAHSVRYNINKAFATFKCITSGKDMKKFLKAMAGLWVLSVIGSWFNFLTLFYLVFVTIFSLPALYDRYEDEVDVVGAKAMVEINKHYAVLDAKLLRKLPRCLLDKKRS